MAKMKCIACGLSKDLTDFDPSQKHPGRPERVCRLCKKAPVGFRPGDSLHTARNSPTGEAIRNGSLDAAKSVVSDGLKTTFAAVKDQESLQKAVVAMLPEMLTSLLGRAKSGDGAAWKQLVDIAGGPDALNAILAGAASGSDGSLEPSLFDLMADLPGEVTDSA